MDLMKEAFGPLETYIEDNTITDIDYSGGRLWLTDIYNKRSCVQEAGEWMTPVFVEQFSQRIANLISAQFNRQHPVLEAETPELRVTIVHESAARSGRSISIRKTPPVVRLTEEKMIEEGYTDEDTLKLLLRCVRGGLNMVFCGMPGVGKTELLKFCASHIPAGDRVITIEDTMEIRYAETNPGKDCIEMKVQDRFFDYTAAIKTSLRLNPKWLILSEARSREVKYLMESWSTGVSGMTTLHTDSVKNIPDRILNMMEKQEDVARLENDIYRVLDVGVLISKRQDYDGSTIRYIDQLCFFLRENGQNKVRMMVNNGQRNHLAVPQAIAQRMYRYELEQPDYDEKDTIC